MGLELNFNIKSAECCNELLFTDTTCVYDSNKPANCCDGYGVEDNITKYQIGGTRFNWQLPDGQVFTNINVGWVPGLGARASFTIDSATAGVIVVCVGGKQLGKEVYVDDLSMLAQALVDDINSNTDSTGWYAMITDDATNQITLYSVSTGVENNDLGVDLYVTDDLTVTLIDALTLGANDGSDSYTFTMFDLISANCDSEVSTDFPDGIHRVDYIVYNLENVEVSRVVKHVFVDCKLLSMLRALAKLVISNDCKCNSAGLSKKLILFRARYDAAKIMFSEGDYKCANEEIQQLLEDLENVCLDCD
jgi:hypothetical protein